MAITAALVFAKGNLLRYLITATVGSGEAVSIECDGGATPDLQTDSPAGPIKNISKVKGAGYGKISSAGVTTDAQCRALWLSDDAESLVGTVPTAECRLTPRTGGGWAFTVTAARGPSDQATPGLSVAAPGAAGTAYLDVLMPGSIGV